MPFTRVITSFGDPDDDDNLEDAERTRSDIENQLGYSCTVERDFIDVQVRADFDTEENARAAALRIRGLTGLFSSLLDPETGDESDEVRA